MDIQKALETSNDITASASLLTEAFQAAKNANNTGVGEEIAKKIFANLASKSLPDNLIDELISSSKDPAVFESLTLNQKLTTNAVKSLYEKVSSLYKGTAHEEFSKFLKAGILRHQNLGKAMLNYLARNDKIIATILEKQSLRNETFLKFLKDGDEVVRNLICRNIFLKDEIIQKIDQTSEVQEGLKIRDLKLKSLENNNVAISKKNKITTTKPKEENTSMSDESDEELSFFGEMKAIAGETLIMSAASAGNEFAVDGLKGLAEKFGVNKELLESPAFNMLLKPLLPALLMIGASSQKEFIAEHLGESVFDGMNSVFGAALEEANVESMNTMLEAIMPALKELVSSGQLQLESGEDHGKMLNEAAVE